MKKLTTIVPFPSGAESDPFIAALSSAAVTAFRYDENTPYFCAANDCYCKHCSPCGDNLLERHQESIYHCLLTATGLAFGFDYPWDDTVVPHSLPGYPTGWRWDDDFIGYVMRFLGLTYRRFNQTNSSDDIFMTITSAIDAGYPTLARQNDTINWQLITGYEDKTLFGLQMYGNEFVSNDWNDIFCDIIVMTGSCERDVEYLEILHRIEDALTYPEHHAVEEMTFTALDLVTEETAMDAACMICYGIVGVPIEARWHAGEAFSSKYNLLNILNDNAEIYHRLSTLLFDRYIANDHNETHGIGWKIWGLLGFGPNTGYQVTENAVKAILDPNIRSEIKKLLRYMFENDHMVWKGISEILGDKNHVE